MKAKLSVIPLKRIFPWLLVILVSLAWVADRYNIPSKYGLAFWAAKPQEWPVHDFYDQQRVEIEDYIFATSPCNSSLPALEWLRDISDVSFQTELSAIGSAFISYVGDLYPYREPRVILQQRIEENAEYTVDLLHFESRAPSQTAVAYLAVPKGAPDSQLLPAIVVLHGMGSDPEQALGLTDSNYMNDIGKRLLRRGYVVMAPFIFSDEDWILRALLYLRYNEESLTSLVIAKLQASLDLLLLDQRVDPARVGVYGISWGGVFTRTWAAVDERVRLTVVSGQPGDSAGMIASRTVPFSQYTTGTPLVPSYYHCNISTGMVYACLIAPRPLILERGTGDIFIAYGVEEMYPILLQIYQRLGYPDQVHLVVFEGGHEINPGDETLDLIDSYLKK